MLQYKQIGSIKDFSSRKIYWNQIPQKQLQKLLSSNLTSTEIAETFFPKNSYMHQYIFSQNRAPWKVLLKLQNKTILDLGCGWGALSLEFSKVAKHVISADSTLETLQFVEKRIKENNFKNIELICINPLSQTPLPLEDESVDIVLLNGVLEWIAQYTRQNPKKLQLKLLKDLSRILKPDGLLITAIENRFGYVYFCGYPDEHTFALMQDERLKYTTILPRFLSNLISQKHKKKPYDTYTYSLSGYKKLFKKSGFKSTRTFILEQDYRFPKYWLPLEGNCFNKQKQTIEQYISLLHKAHLDQFLLSHPSFWLTILAKNLYRFLTFFKLHKYFAHQFLFISSRLPIDQNTINESSRENFFEAKK